MKHFIVRTKETCPECKGEKYVHNDLFREWAEAAKQWEKDNPQPSGERCGREWLKARDTFDNGWFADRGYPGGPKNWPPEEWPCGNCDGKGKIEQETNLEQALEEIGVLKRLKALERAAYEANCYANGVFPD